MENELQIIQKEVQNLNGEFSTLVQLVVSSLNKINGNFEFLNKKIDAIEGNIEEIKKSVKDLQGATSDGFVDVGGKLENLSDEISKIGKVTNYQAEWVNLKAIS